MNIYWHKILQKTTTFVKLKKKDHQLQKYDQK